MQQQRGQWGSRAGFVLAAVGSAVGLGNVWKFPYITGENGGGLFVLIYLGCIALVGLPILMAEIMIGRAAQRQPVAAFHALQGRRTAWASVGWLGVAAGFIILSFYVVVAGWAADYTLKSIVNFTAPIHQSATTEARAEVAAAEIESLRSDLAKRRVDRLATRELELVRREARPSAWRDRAEWETLDESGRSRLAILNPRLADSIRLTDPLEARIAEIRADQARLAEAHYAALADEAVLLEAEDQRRRQRLAAEVADRFGILVTDGWTSLFWAAIVMLVTILIVAGGVSAGIERTCRVLMPLLFGIIVAMCAYSAFQPGFSEAIRFVFMPDPSRLRASGVLEALGHAFFTLSLGMGAMITYGSYQRTKDHLVGQSIAIAGLDTVIALLACLMMFPIVFSYGQAPSAGPGLVFVSMPLAFAEIGQGGMLLAIAFFGLLVFAALTSAISLLEVVASYFIDERGWSRPRAAWSVGLACLAFGGLSAFSMDTSFAMRGFEGSSGKNFFDTMDYLTSNWMLPLGGLLIAVYAGWVMPRRLQKAEVEGLNPLFLWGWLLLVRFVAPALIVVVLLQKIGIVDVNELIG